MSNHGGIDALTTNEHEGDSGRMVSVKDNSDGANGDAKKSMDGPGDQMKEDAIQGISELIELEPRGV